MNKNFEGHLGYSNSIINYCVTYKESYFFMFDSIKKSNKGFDEVLEPMLFLLRHSFELGLKYNIKYLSIATGKRTQVNLGREHNLNKLTEDLGQLINYLKLGDTLLTKEIARSYKLTIRLANQITKLDKNGTSFRYNVKSPLLKKQRLVKINLLKLNDLFDKVYIFLRDTHDVLQDNYKIGKPYVDEKLKEDLKKGEIN